MEIYLRRERLAEYKLPPDGVKNEKFSPEGYPKPRYSPHNRRRPTELEEKRLRDMGEAVNQYLVSCGDSVLGTFISDENHEIAPDVEKAIHLLRGDPGDLRLDRIIEKGFFIDSSKSLLLQLCDLCAYSVRKLEEDKNGMALRDIDRGGVQLVRPLIERASQAQTDVLQWLQDVQKEKAARD